MSISQEASALSPRHVRRTPSGDGWSPTCHRQRLQGRTAFYGNRASLEKRLSRLEQTIHELTDFRVREPCAHSINHRHRRMQLIRQDS